MDFNWERFLSNDNTVVCCATEEEARDFCKQMNERGLTWSSGESYLDDTHWHSRIINSYLGLKKCICYTSKGTHSNMDYFEENGYDILKWSDYKKKH